MMSEFTIILPCRIALSDNKYFNLNLNNYRNAHYHVLNRAKVNYTKYVQTQLLTYKFSANKLIVSYMLIPANKRRIDTFNFLSIVDKFFLDALVCCGIIKDDNYKYISYGMLLVGKINETIDYHVVQCNVTKEL